MVYRVKGTLTEEDRRAWKRAAARRKKEFRSGYRPLLLLWLLMKLLGISLLGLAGYVLVIILKSDIWLLMKLCGMGCALVFAYFGTGLLRLFFRPPARPQDPPARDFPPAELPDVPVRAAFFGDGCFVFWRGGVKTRLRYQDISGLWEDRLRFYFFFEDRPPLILRKCDFAGWNWQAFRSFIAETLGYEIRWIQ